MRKAAMGAVALLALAGIAALAFWLGHPRRGPAIPAAPPPGQAQTAPPTPGQPSQAQPPQAVPPPSFDVVRVAPDGTAVVAGRGPAGAAIDLLGNGGTLATATAGPDGSWTIVLSDPLPPGTMELSLVARPAGGGPIASDKLVEVQVPPRGGQGQAMAVLVDRQPAAPGAPASSPRILQAPAAGGAGELALNAVTYGETGAMQLSGSGAPGRIVRFYLNDRLFGEATVDGGGRWQFPFSSDVKPGRYRLRLDEVDAAGHVQARREIPIERADPRGAAGMQAKAGASDVVVQPGTSLWRIARRSYGRGMRYVDIYEANRNQIRNPDRIYPGQVLDLP